MISIKNSKVLQKFEDDFVREEKISVQEKFNLLDDFYNFAFSIGKLVINDSQQNLEALIKTTKVFRDASKITNKNSKRVR